MITSIWPPGDHTIETLPDHPMMRQVGVALEPLRPLLRKLESHIREDDPMPSVTLGLGAEFHLISIQLLDEETLLIDLPVGELLQMPENLQRLLSDNLSRNWPFRVDSVVDTTPAQVIVVIESRLPFEDVERLHQKVLEGWMTKVVDEGLLRFLNGKGENL